jgi:hypothetical protein
LSILDDGTLATSLTDALIGADIPQSCVVTTQEQTGDPWAPVTVNVDHNCSGWVDSYDTAERANGDVQVNDRKVFVLCASLDVVPAPSNTVTIGGSTYSIITVTRDPAGACWVCQCRT